MLFNSFEFLIFFPTVVGLFFLLPHRFRWLLLLIASYTFYMFWRVDYAILLAISTLMDYVCGLMMDRHPVEATSKRKPWLWASLTTNLGTLFVFKYYNFFNTAAKDLADVMGVSYAAPAFELLLPMGISFYTFQTMSYTIDVYYGRQKAERHLGIFALFVTFFPQLTAGPIERAGNLIDQLKVKHEFDYQRVTDGLKLFAWGLFKKVVIADRLSVMVNQVYNNPTDYEGIPLIIATVFFAFQIYCDFSGYSDMAIGSAQVMGIRLMENFRRPYFSKSIKEFWSRWHISLSSWFRDYLYIPLGGNRVVKWRWYYNLFIVFLVSGIWHGANWTFIVWGALHGFYQVFGILTAKQRDAVVERLRLNSNKTFYKLIQIGTTFVLVCLAWVFFRANTISDALYITTHMFSGLGESIKEIIYNTKSALIKNVLFEQAPNVVALSFFFVIFLFLFEFLQEEGRKRIKVSSLPTALRWGVYYILIITIITLGVYKSNEFIYFQF